MSLIPKSMQQKISFKQAAGFKLTFGKHTGKRLDDIDITYLDWLQDNCSDALTLEHLNVYMEDPSVQADLDNALSERASYYDDYDPVYD